jgi:hypothetical protein
MFIMLLVILSVAGCRGGRYDLTKSQLKVDIQGAGKVAIGVQDQRPYILDYTKPPTYIGIHRNGWGVPRDAGTRSGQSLAEDVATIMVSSFGASGFAVERFSLSPNENLESSLKRLESSAYDKIVVLTLDQFRSDSWAEVELQWAITMRVYDGKGRLLAEKDSTGTVEGLKRNYTGAISGGQAQKAIATKLTTILAELINAPECQRAMLNPDSSVPGNSAPTSKQVQEAIEMELPDPPEGFIWKSYKNVVFPKPAQWREQQAVSAVGIPITTYATSPEEFSATKQFEMGFTVQIITGCQKLKGIEAKKMVLLLLKPDLDAHKKEEILMLEQSTNGDFEQTFFRYKDAPPGLTPIIVHKFVLANNVTDSVHVFTFESPMESWKANWTQYGTPILSKIIFQSNVPTTQSNVPTKRNSTKFVANPAINKATSVHQVGLADVFHYWCRSC